MIATSDKKVEEVAREGSAISGLGIYVQVPFCQTKCTYCNFHTGVVSSARFTPYMDAVCKEIRGWRELYREAGLRVEDGRSAAIEKNVIETVYIGGGTPSMLEPRLLAQLLATIRETFAGEPKEVTLEADPETVTEEKAAAWVHAGINRVSFGVQSFVDAELKAAGRMHRAADVFRAHDILRKAGITNISFDLIAGLPHQTRRSWQESLDELRKLAPEHVSIYLLEVDEGSRLGKELLQGGTRYSASAVPSDDEMAECYEAACESLRTAGYEHYEISNWAKPGFASRHNLKYWQREPYLGFGAGAHSFSGSERWANAHDAAEYVKAIEGGRLPAEQRETVTKEMALEEELFLGLRKLEGIDVRRIERIYGVELDERFAEFETAGLVEREGDVVRLAEGKLSVSNEVFVGLMR
ncbi:MAG TPA: radical SAM family heme chaperone HemW [Candidatus Acidoferrum sp.]|nr:radical SAM family heme chaperone HemW [Candidatus Acidoferrum sp.]